jgi:hypothetical protein
MELFILMGLLWIIKDIFSLRYLLKLLMRLTLAALPMGILLYWLTSPEGPDRWLGGMWGIVPGLAIYCIGCVVLGCISVRDVSALIRGFLMRGSPRGGTTAEEEPLS